MPFVRACIFPVFSALVGCGGGRAPSPSSAPDAPAQGASLDAAVASISSAERGLAFVRARGCAGCHQSSDPSEGTLSGRTTPLPATAAYPANLTPDVETGLGGWSADAIVDAMRSGIDDEGERLCAPMPHFADMTDDEASAIVAYLRALPPVRREIPSSVCPEEPDAGAADGQSDAAPSCSSWAAPATPAGCHACGAGDCQPNGCFGGFWCDPSARRCHPPPC